jgi:uracil-DNA glycosylase
VTRQTWRWPDTAVLEREGLDARWAGLWRAFETTTPAQALRQWLEARVAAQARIVPAQALRAMQLTPSASVRVVILGQDPYHGVGQAHGLAFSVPDSVALPPSLRNIYAEITRDLNRPPPAGGNLERWARQGVLLLNVVLTVELDAPARHAKRGWEGFTASVIDTLARDPMPKVFLLWGAFARQFEPAIAANPQHLALWANHPSPLSARRPPVPFVGCGHFSRANAFLAQHGRGTIDW